MGLDYTCCSKSSFKSAIFMFGGMEMLWCWKIALMFTSLVLLSVSESSVSCFSTISLIIWVQHEESWAVLDCKVSGERFFCNHYDPCESTWYDKVFFLLSAIPVLISVGSMIPGQSETCKSSVVFSIISRAALKIFGSKMMYGSSPQFTLLPRICTVKWQMPSLAIDNFEGLGKRSLVYQHRLLCLV